MEENIWGDLATWHIGSNIIKRCSLVGISVGLLEEVCGGLRGPMLKMHPFQKRESPGCQGKDKTPPGCIQIKIENYQLVLQHYVCLDTVMLPARMIMDLTSKIVSQSQLNVFAIRVSLIMVTLLSNKMITNTKSPRN